jgi:hypothetical protein
MAGFNADVFEYAKTEVDRLEAEFLSELADLKAAASSQFSPMVTTDGFANNPTWSIAAAREVVFPGMNDLPSDRPTITLPPFVFNPEEFITADMLTQYSYVSAFFDDFLEGRLKNYIDSQSYFLATEVQDALFNASRARDIQTQNDALDMVDRVQARRGFPIPSSMMLAARNDVIKKYQDTVTDRNKEITALIADKSLQEKMHAMDTSIKMEDIRSRFALEYGKMYWQAAEYIVRKYEVDVNTEISTFKAELDMLMKKAEVDLDAAGKDIDFERLKHEREMKRLDASLTEVDANVRTWVASLESRSRALREGTEYFKQAASGWLSQTNAVNYEEGAAPTA